MAVETESDSKSEKKDITDDFTDIVGGHGRWQWQIFLIYFFTCFPSAWHNLVMTFFAPNIDHWCARSDEALAANISTDLWKLQMIPSQETEDGAIHYSRCDRYDTEFNVTLFLTGKTEEFFSVRNYSNETVLCQKWEYDDKEYSSTVVSQWDLVCDREWLISVTKSVFMAGYLVAVLVFGQISDKYGRRPVLLISNVIFLLSGLVCVFSVSFTMFAISRFFIALGSSGLLTTGFVMLMEVVGVQHRPLFGVGTGFGWSTGYVLLPLIAHFIPDWFWLQVALTLPCVLLLILWWLVPESPRWLLTQGERGKAQEIMKSIAIRNGKNVTNLESSTASLCEQYKMNEGGELGKGNALDLIRVPGLRGKTLNLSFNWCVNAFIYYGISYNTNDLGGSAHLNFLISGVIEFPAVVASIYIIKKVGRRIPLMGFMVVGGAACILIFTVPEEMMWLQVTLAMLGKFCISASFDIVYVYSAEVYPTVLRNIGIGTSSMCARLGSIAAPFVRELGSATHPSVPFLCYGGLSILSGALVLLLPETNNCKIPDTIEEAAQLGRKVKTDSVGKVTDHRKKNEVSLAFIKGNPEEMNDSTSSIS